MIYTSVHSDPLTGRGSCVTSVVLLLSDLTIIMNLVQWGGYILPSILVNSMVIVSSLTLTKVELRFTSFTLSGSCKYARFQFNPSLPDV